MFRIAAFCTALVLGGAAAAHDKPHHHKVHTYGQGYSYGHNYKPGYVVTRTVTITCYRGPWSEVIWDRPEPAFLESLAAVGYRPEEALAIGETVCRDKSIVGNPEGQKTKLRQILRTNPPRKS